MRPHTFSVAQRSLFALRQLLYSAFSLFFNKEDNGQNNVLVI